MAAEVSACARGPAYIYGPMNMCTNTYKYLCTHTHLGSQVCASLRKILKRYKAHPSKSRHVRDTLVLTTISGPARVRSHGGPEQLIIGAVYKLPPPLIVGDGHMP